MSAETGPRISLRNTAGGAAGTFAHTGTAVPLLGQAPPLTQPRFAAAAWQASYPDGAALSAAA
jgi:hypothetical protein